MHVKFVMFVIHITLVLKFEFLNMLSFVVGKKFFLNYKN